MNLAQLLRRVTGLGVGGALALALLAGGCVLAATAGPRQAQYTQVRALRQAVGKLAPLQRAVVVDSDSQSIGSAQSDSGGNPVPLSEADFDGAAAQLRRDFAVAPLSMAPASADRWKVTSSLYGITSGPPTPTGDLEQVEVADLDPAGTGLRLLAGRLPGAAPRPAATKAQETDTFQVAVTRQTAAQFGLRPGSRLMFDGPMNYFDQPPLPTTVVLDVTGIVAPADPGAVLWQTDPLLTASKIVPTAFGTYLDGAVLASPAELGPIQQVLGGGQLPFEWVLPTDLSQAAGPAQALLGQVSRLTAAVPPLTGNLSSIANALRASSGLLMPLATFVRYADEVQSLLLVLYAGLAVATAMVLLLAARAVTVGRRQELAVTRARGASVRQLAARAALGAAAVCAPAAALAWTAAALLVPDPVSLAGAGAWWPGTAAVAVAVAGPAAVAAWQHRLPRRSHARGRRWRWVPRVIAEATACAAAAGGIEVFRVQAGTASLYASTAPVLIAVPAVIVAVRAQAALVGALARTAARGRGLVGFLGLARAAQGSASRALPAMTLVVLLTLAAFTGMVRSAVAGGETAASWQAAGADATVSALGTGGFGTGGFSAGGQRAIAGVAGVRHAAAVTVLPLQLPGSQVVTGLAVDPASYAALAASSPGYSPVSPALLARQPGRPVPVLASPQAAAVLGQPGNASLAPQDGQPAFPVSVAGVLASTPALPAGGAFVVFPAAALAGPDLPQANLMLLNGPVDAGALRAAAALPLPGGSFPLVATRAQALAALTQAPVQQGTYAFFSLALAYAAALAAAVLLLELALGAAERKATLARLATMGLAEGQRVRLVVCELLPALAASAAAAAACALSLPWLIGQQVSLTVFTQASASPPLRADPAAVLLPLAALLAVTALALAYEVRTGRGRGVAVTLRTTGGSRRY